MFNGKPETWSIGYLIDVILTRDSWMHRLDLARATNGTPVLTAERARARSLDIGLIFQSFNLIGDLTVYENVEYPLTLRGASPAERRATVEAALERVGIANRAKQRPSSLSGGHQQLVAVARAIAGRPAVLLADEPTGNLDSATSGEIMTLLTALNRQGITILMVTHEADIAAHARTIVHFLDGQVEKVETRQGVPA